MNYVVYEKDKINYYFEYVGEESYHLFFIYENRLKHTI